MQYDEFLRGKMVRAAPRGAEVPIADISDRLFPFQRAIVQWALRRGCAAIWAECGLGKTAMQLEWARIVAARERGAVLVLAPLAVASQTRREGEKFGIHVTVCRSQADVDPRGVNVANYEMAEHFDPAAFVGVVLDESSILKNFMGKTKRMLMEMFRATRWKLCCTATPAPNDHLEIGNHAHFLDVMESTDMIARWFVNDPMEAGTYRLKGHAAADFWRWVHSWAVYVERPSDLGDYSDEGYVLPKLTIVEHVVEVDGRAAPESGALFRDGNLSATTLHQEMRLTAPQRAAVASELVRAAAGPVVVWCHTDYEADALRAELPGAIEVRGSMSPEAKESGLDAFSTGAAREIITKPRIAGLGLNWQHCATAVYVGLSYSYESLYQSIRRIWRFGQTRDVTVHLVRASTEGALSGAIAEKQARHEEMKRSMKEAMRAEQRREKEHLMKIPVTPYASGKDWRLILGDCVESLRNEPDNSIGITVTSPPFSNLYIYSDGLQDMGNSADDGEFLVHLRFLADELHRVTMPGRVVALHCKDLPLYKGRDGSAGLRDFPGDMLRVFIAAGFTFHSRVTIWKCPVTEMQRTKNHGLLYKNLRADSSVSRQGMADYVITVRKWSGIPNDGTQSPEPVTHTTEEFPLDQWQEWASPVWMTIDQMNVLDYKDARDDKDERHICPLQLDVIERCIRLWSNPGDVVLDPFNGIGSVGYVALRHGRRYLGTELKPSYCKIAAKKLAEAARDASVGTLFGASA